MTTKLRRMAILGMAVITIVTQGLVGCGGDQKPTPEQVKAFQGGPPPPSVQAQIQAAMSHHPTGRPTH